VGRIVTPVRVENARDPSRSILIDALVDTGASHLVLPSAWRDRLGELTSLDSVELELATQETARGEVCGPVKIEIEGFRAIFGEVLFVEMHPEGGSYEPLLGYIPLEQSQAAVDLVGHRLLRAKHFDLK
jgi:predicted aspartyl protease